MKPWNEMTEDEQDEAIARTFFGWTPIQCHGEPGKVYWPSEYNSYSCSICYASTDDWAQESDLVHQIIPHGGWYTRLMNQAWKVVERVTQPPKTTSEAERAANTRFALWFDQANLWAMTSKEAAEAICKAALDAVGYWEQANVSSATLGHVSDLPNGQNSGEAQASLYQMIEGNDAHN